MQRSDVLQQLKQYIAERILEGKDVGLDESTPLLEWGIINSFEMIQLLSFIQKQFNVRVPLDKLNASYFTNLPSITNLVFETMAVDVNV